MIITILSKSSDGSSGKPDRYGLLTEHVNRKTGELMYLPWRTSTWGEIRNKDPKELFGEVNDFIEKLPEDVQDQIWDCYKTSSEIMLDVHDTDAETRDKLIQAQLERLFSFFNIDDIARHLEQYPVMIDPNTRVVTPALEKFIKAIREKAANDSPDKPLPDAAIIHSIVNQLKDVENTGTQREIDYSKRDAFATLIYSWDRDYRAVANRYGFELGLIRELYDRIVNPEYPKEQTYDEYDYRDLLPIIFYFKLATPIMGTYADIVKDEVGTPHKEMKTFRLFWNSPINDYPATQKLWDYCIAWATGKKASKNAAFTLGIPTEDVPFYYIALVTINRMPQFRFQETGFTFMHYIFRFIKSRGDELNKGAPTATKAGKKNGDEESDGVVEQYRIATKIPDNIPTAMASYVWAVDESKQIPNMLRFARDVMQAEVNSDELLSMLKTMHSYRTFTLSSFHFPIFKIVLSRCIYDAAIPSMNREALFSVVTVCAYWLKHNGFPDLASLLFASRTDRPLGVMSVGGLPFEQLTPDNTERLIARYPHIYQGSRKEAEGNPGLEFIAETVKVVNRHDWSFDTNQLLDLRNSLARLLTLDI